MKHAHKYLNLNPYNLIQCKCLGFICRHRKTVFNWKLQVLTGDYNTSDVINSILERKIQSSPDLTNFSI